MDTNRLHSEINQVMIENHIKEIQELGYTVIKGFIENNQAKELRSFLPYENLVKNSTHSDFIYNLQNIDIKYYKIFIRNMKLKQILSSCLNDQWYRQIPDNYDNFILRGLVARSSSKAPLKMHIDSFIPYQGEEIINLICMLSIEESNAKNGCTIVVPRSHKSGSWANQESINDAIEIENKPGDLLIVDTRLWHGARANQSTKTRWTITATFSRWWIKQSYDISRGIPSENLKDLNDEEKSILGFCNNPPINEKERINIQGGYELLP